MKAPRVNNINKPVFLSPKKDYLFDVIAKMELGAAEAIFLSCTNLPALNIIDRLEKKLNKIVLSSNQVLIWDTLKSLGKTEKVKGFGKLFLKN